MQDAARVMIWADTGRETLLSDVVQRAKLDVVAIGGGIDMLEAARNAERERDLRLALQRDDVDLMLLATQEELTQSMLALLTDRPVRVISFEPQPGSLTELGEGDTSPVIFGPLFRHSPGSLAASQHAEAFGRVEAANVVMRWPDRLSSLFARMVDAFDLLIPLMGRPESIDAATISAGDEAPESPRGLRSRMTLHLRFEERRSASIMLAENVGPWFRGVSLIGASGCMVISDAGLEWTDGSGAVLEAWSIDEQTNEANLAGACAAMIRRTLDAKRPAEPPADMAGLLAMAEAARLSCRTGQSESPRRLAEVLRRF